jgi:hypothetical protein
MGSHLRSSSVFWAGAIAIALSGCGGPKLAPVHGRVTLHGKPVTTGKIRFYPEAGRPALGVIAPDGTYTLTTFTPGDGALLGAHRITIYSTSVGSGSMTEPKSVEEELALAKKGYPPGKWLVAGKVTWLVPEKYSRQETSPLTATVENKTNELNFDIPAEK